MRLFVRVGGYDERMDAAPAALQGMHAYLTLDSLGIREATRAELLDLVRQFEWSSTFGSLATLASALANGPDESSIGRTQVEHVRVPLQQQTHSLDYRLAAIAERLRQVPPEAPIAHEQVLYFLQALTVLEGADAGAAPAKHEIARLALVANGHLMELMPGSGALDQVEAAVVDIGRLSRFGNAHPDLAARVGRFVRLLEQMPEQGPFKSPEDWRALGELAFGRPFEDFADILLVPLVMLSTSWGMPDPATRALAPPLVHPTTWFAQTRVSFQAAAPFFERVTWTREELRAKLRRRQDGLPASLVTLYHRPFLRLGPDALCCASPWLLWEQLRYGAWNRFRETCNALGEEWLPTFGVLFEQWCKWVADVARKKPGFSGLVVLAERIGGPDEIEDVVFLHSDIAVLFSVKGGLVPEEVARGGPETRKTALEWYERFFFAKRQGRYPDGAVRLLSEKIDRLRQGGYEPRLPRACRVIPVLVSYDNLGESFALYRWLTTRCTAESLLQQENVAPLTIATVDDFEGLFSLAARGVSMLDVLVAKTSQASRERRLRHVLMDFRRGVADLRLEELHQAFGSITARSGMKLFGRPFEIPAAPGI